MTRLQVTCMSHKIMISYLHTVPSFIKISMQRMNNSKFKIQGCQIHFGHGCFMILIFISIFSSISELFWSKIFVICRCCCRRKRFTFSSSTQDPLGQFQPNLTESIIGGTYYTINFLNKVIKKYTKQFWISTSLICLNCF